MGVWEAPEGWSGTKSEDGTEKPCRPSPVLWDGKERPTMTPKKDVNLRT